MRCCHSSRSIGSSGTGPIACTAHAGAVSVTCAARRSVRASIAAASLPRCSRITGSGTSGTRSAHGRGTSGTTPAVVLRIRLSTTAARSRASPSPRPLTASRITSPTVEPGRLGLAQGPPQPRGRPGQLGAAQLLGQRGPQLRLIPGPVRLAR